MGLQAIHYKTGHPIDLTIEDGTFSAVNPHPAEESLPYIAPGFIDLQVNGYRGVDFNTPPLNFESIKQVCRALASQGVTTFYPTVITNSPDHILALLQAIRKAAEQDDVINRMMAGIHLEGPYISPKDGPRGAHNQQYVKGSDWTEFLEWQEASGGRISIITLSPEWPNSVDFIKKCTSQGIVVSIGHTSAEPEQIQEAVKAGARLSTHLGNGADLFLKRHPNYLWEQLASDHLSASMIADGFHLPDSVLKVFIRMKGEKAILISDCVSLAGMPSGKYDLHIGGAVELHPSGRLSMRDQPELLAGSAQSQLWGINHLLKKEICDLTKAIDMASVYPAALLELPQQMGIAAGAPADFILFHRTPAGIEVVETYKRGIKMYKNREAYV
ncbi:N-acetylglucosamine-6-phosphate deacetylase [Fictibacillus solisalsi]|uniref:N-acetylglucosamine-6-phosphate deacetylase n=1 Tax=Fictibacillus solisalsi TaxID=459525 RepID=A0A1G9YJ01_9BACL|nr:amidohydrolase family protein [Fictibacillus solisalsi]SDN08882.1 N-acetylglucosamine-6-phosphate deacetylase [Fictibacillus solisalsi]